MSQPTPGPWTCASTARAMRDELRRTPCFGCGVKFGQADDGCVSCRRPRALLAQVSHDNTWVFAALPSRNGLAQLVYEEVCNPSPFRTPWQTVTALHSERFGLGTETTRRCYHIADVVLRALLARIAGKETP